MRDRKAQPNPPPRADHERRGRGGWLTLATLCLAVLIAQLDSSVVNLAVRPIGERFRAGTAALQWVVDSYNLVYAVLLLTGGLLADLRGRRLVFMAGAAVLTAASVLCAAAPSIALLVAGRALAGVGAALILPASLAIIRVAWPDPTERARALGVWAGCNGVSLAIGPTLGGVLIEAFGWRSIFAVAVPLGIAALALAVPTLPESADPAGRDFDGRAKLLGAGALGGLALAVIGVRDAPLLAAAALVASALGLVLFLRAEAARGPSALVPLDLFRVRAFRGAVLATAGMTFGMYGVLFLLPLSWQREGLLDALGAGLALLPMALVFVLVSPLSGRLTALVGARLMTSGGVAVIGCGLLVLAATAGSRSVAPAEVGLALTGLGMGFATGPLLAVAVGAVAAARSGTAAALINVARMTGATVGVAAFGAAYALVGGGPPGLGVAMAFGGAVQLACAGFAWRQMRAGGAAVPNPAAGP